MHFIYSVQSEWLKTKKSLSSWLCLIGGVFIPAIYLVDFLRTHSSINGYISSKNIWEVFFYEIWRFMATAILPMSVVLISSLITQLEFRNNTWKVLYCTPQKFSVIFWAKFSTIVLMIFKLLIFFNIGLILAGTIPCLIFDHGLPKQSLPVWFFIVANLKVFLTCLPVIALQFLLSLYFKNYLIPVGIGFLGLVTAFVLIKTWKFAYILPYSLTPLLILGNAGISGKVNIYLLSGVYFFITMIICYFLYITKKEKA